MNLALLIFGNLAGPECSRALARGWLLVVRTLAALVLALVALFLIWIWWLSALGDPSFVPDVGELRIALSAAALILLTIAVVQVPAVLAGSLAGERERGVLQLLLTTAVSPREIVLGRLLGKLSQVGMILLAGLPFLALLVAWNGFGLLHLAMIVFFLTAVSLGGGGLAVGASVVSRRGRDALLTVYILMMILTLSPMLWWLGLPVEVTAILESFNPYLSMNRLVWSGNVVPALATAGFWLLLGLAGTAVAAWRLRPTCVGPTGSGLKASHRGRVRPLGERPMLWKELYIERVGTLGRFGRWLGILFTVLIGGGSVVLTGMILVPLVRQTETDWAAMATHVMAVTLGGSTGMFLGWLLQWALGLRAAVSIASERERATWDALLMSPLAGGEIVQAKLYGSLHALRWMVGAMLVAWTLAAAVGAMSLGSTITWLAGNAVACAYMAAVGVRCSLSLPSATRAMTWTIALWLAGQVVVSFFALSVIAIVVTLCLVVWSIAVQYGLVLLNSTPWFPMSFGTGWPLATDLVTLLITIMIVADTRLRFDAIAGRMAGGAVATTVDAWLRGRLHQPVLLPGRKAAWRANPATDPAELLESAPTAPAVAEVATTGIAGGRD